MIISSIGNKTPGNCVRVARPAEDVCLLPEPVACEHQYFSGHLVQTTLRNVFQQILRNGAKYKPGPLAPVFDGYGLESFRSDPDKVSGPLKYLCRSSTLEAAMAALMGKAIQGEETHPLQGSYALQFKEHVQLSLATFCGR